MGRLLNQYRFELINKAHDVSLFDCGNPLLNLFLQRTALIETQQDLSRTYLLWDDAVAGLESFIGYFTLAADSLYLQREDVGERYLCPLVRLQYLGRDLRRRGEAIGDLLLIEALGYVVSAADIVGIAGVHLDTTAEGRPLYERYGFEPHSYSDQKLLLSIADARAIVAAAS